MFNLLISPIAELAGTWLKGKVDKSKAESEVKVARAKAEAKVYETEATSQMLNEKNLTDQMGDSLKDEFWTLIFGIFDLLFYSKHTTIHKRRFYIFRPTYPRMVF